MNTDITIFLMNTVLALFAFFGVAPMVLNAISTFGVQYSFSRAMIEEGVITEADMKLMHPKKQIAGLVISIILIAVLGVAMYNTRPLGWFTGGIPLAAGFLRYRRIVQYNSLTVQRFKNTYRDVMDKKKFDKFVKDHF